MPSASQYRAESDSKPVPILLILTHAFAFVLPCPNGMKVSTPLCAIIVFLRLVRKLTREQAGRLFEAMLSDAVMSVALQSHNEITRAQETCALCLTQCANSSMS